MIALPFLYLTTGEHLEHNRWVSRPDQGSLNDCGVHVGGCHILLYFLSSNSDGESHCSFYFTWWCVQCQCSVLMTALPFLYLTTGEHLEHDRKWVRLPHNSLNDCGVCMWVVVTFYCIFFLLTQMVSPTVLYIHPIICAMSVLSSNDCLAFSVSHHWVTFGTWQQVSLTTSRLLEWLICTFVWLSHFTVFSFFQLRGWVLLFCTFIQ